MEKKASVGKRVIKRPTLRHGDLRRALLDAGVELARSGGPSAIVLREATRRAGVAPNAAYRHFANLNELLKAVRAYAFSQLAAGYRKTNKSYPEQH
jgi:AcrR family transcriptional regulator